MVFGHIFSQHHTCSCTYKQSFVWYVSASARLCQRFCVYVRAHALTYTLSATETAAVPDGVCFEVVPGIRSQGGANPGRSLAWWERVPLVCTRSTVRRQRPRTTGETTGPDWSSKYRANCSDNNITYLKSTLSISKLRGALMWPYLELTEPLDLLMDTVVE